MAHGSRSGSATSTRLARITPRTGRLVSFSVCTRPPVAETPESRIVAVSLSGGSWRRRMRMEGGEAAAQCPPRLRKRASYWLPLVIPPQMETSVRSRRPSGAAHAGWLKRPGTARRQLPRHWACTLPGSGITRNCTPSCSLLQGWLVPRQAGPHTAIIAERTSRQLCPPSWDESCSDSQTLLEHERLSKGRPADGEWKSHSVRYMTY